MKAHSSMDVTATVNAKDLMVLFENGELSDSGITIRTSDPELKKFREMVREKL